MKKIIAMTLAAILLCGMIAGCEAEEPKTVSAGTTVEEQAEKLTEEVGTEETEQTEAVTIQETVLHEDSTVKITATGIEGSWSGVDIKLLVENFSDRNIVLSGDNFIVNGVTMPGYLYIDVAAGKKTNGTLSLYSDNLSTAGINMIALVSAKDAHVVDTDTYDTLVEVPFEVVTSAGTEYVQEIDESGDIIFEENGITVVTKIASDSIFGESIILYVRNNAGKDIVVEAENISVNGFTVDGWMYDTVFADTVRFCKMEIYSTSLEENGIEKVEDVTFTINVIDPKTYNRIAQSGELQIVVNG